MGLDKLWVGSFLGTPGIGQRSPRENALSATGLTGRSEGARRGWYQLLFGPRDTMMANHWR